MQDHGDLDPFRHFALQSRRVARAARCTYAVRYFTADTLDLMQNSSGDREFNFLCFLPDPSRGAPRSIFCSCSRVLQLRVAGSASNSIHAKRARPERERDERDLKMSSSLRRSRPAMAAAAAATLKRPQLRRALKCNCSSSSSSSQQRQGRGNDKNGVCVCVCRVCVCHCPIYCMCHVVSPRLFVPPADDTPISSFFLSCCSLYLPPTACRVGITAVSGPLLPRPIQQSVNTAVLLLLVDLLRPVLCIILTA